MTKYTVYLTRRGNRILQIWNAELFLATYNEENTIDRLLARYDKYKLNKLYIETK